MRFALLVALILSTTTARAQDTAVQRDRDEERELGWSNVADASFVLTSGNSSTSALSVDNKLVRTWDNAEFSFRLGALRTNTADDRFAVGTSGDFQVIEDTTRDLDNERYYLFGRYDRDITERLFWVVGSGWDRDRDAGVSNRTLVFGGVGNTWRDTEHMRFKTDYAITFTRRIDFIPDPERDEKFSEARLSWDYMHQLSSHGLFESVFVYFVNLGKTTDYRFDTINSVTSNLNDALALRLGVQFLYQNFPAFEEIDLFDADPGAGGVGMGSVAVRKKKLDTVVRFSLVITL